MQHSFKDSKVLFGFRFRNDAPTEPVTYLPHLEEIATGGGHGEFTWVHVDLTDPAVAPWLDHLPIPDDIRDAVSEPIQRGRLYATDSIVYGQLRDIRVPKDNRPHNLRVGALSLLVTRGLVVTGRTLPLQAVERLRQRVADNEVEIRSPVGLIKEFFNTLNDIGAAILDEATVELTKIEHAVLKSRDSQRRPEILQMRREAISMARDMAYKRTSMLDILREEPPLAERGDYRALRDQLERYRAQIDDVQDYAERCQFLLDEQRASVEEATNRNLYILTIFSAVFMPPTLIASTFGMNVDWLPFGNERAGIWEVSAIMAGSMIMVLIVLRIMRFF